VAVAVIAQACKDKDLKITGAEPYDLLAGEAAMVDIRGGGFIEGLKVWFGDAESAQVLVISDRRIVALTPRVISSGTKDLKVANPDGKSAVLSSALFFKSRLSVAEVQPPSILENAGDLEVRIKGEGFMKGARVLFGDAESGSVLVKDESYIAASVPALSPGTMDLKVINPDGASSVLYDGFQVISVSAEIPLQPMKDEAKKYGIAGSDQDMDTGVAFADINRDGFIDLLLAASRGIRLYTGTKDGGFVDATDNSGLKEHRGVVYGGLFGDLDNDGLPDLVVTGQPCKIYHNLGGARFEEVSERVGLPDGLRGWWGAWADYDRDGMLDLFIGMLADDDYFFHNEGGKLKRVFPELFEKEELAKKYENRQPTTFSAAFADYDNDGFQDLFIGLRGLPSRFFHSKEGRAFENVSEAMGIGTPLPGPQGKSYFKPDWGISWGDFDNDGFLDVFSASGPVDVDLYRNRDGKKLVNVSKQMRAVFTKSVLCPAWGDLDNDGWLDIAVSDNLSGLRAYRNLGDGSFKDVTSELGIENVMGNAPMGISWIDLNRDGALDLYSVEYMFKNRLYMNSRIPGRHYLEVVLEGKKSNSMAIGAVVTIKAGATIMTRQVSAGDGYLSQAPTILHFGLGFSEKVDLLTVRWPDGETQTMEQVAADRVLEIVEQGERKTTPLTPPVTPAPGSTSGEGASPGTDKK
jgi:hypothetical protein